MTIVSTPVVDAVQSDSQADLPEGAEIGDLRERRLFVSLDSERNGHVTRQALIRALARASLDAEDSRLRECMAGLAALGVSDPIKYDQFCRIIHPNILFIELALQGNLVIPDFEEFTQKIDHIYRDTHAVHDDDLARYINQLTATDPEQYAEVQRGQLAQVKSVLATTARSRGETLGKPTTAPWGGPHQT